MILSVAGAIAIVIGIAGSAQFTTHYQTHLISFTLEDNVSGLRKGDDVRLGGLKVGTVEEIRFDKKGALGNDLPAVDSIVVGISLPVEYTLAVDAKASIESSLTGVTSVNITDLGSGSALADDALLAGSPDSLTAFKSSLATLGPKLNDDLDKIHHTLDTYDKAGSTASTDVHQLATDLRVRVDKVEESAVAALDAVRGWFGPSTGDFHESVANIRAITGGLKKDLPPITASTHELLVRLNATVEKAQGSMDDIKATAANARVMTATARSVIVRNQGRFDEIIAGLKKTSDNLTAASVEIRASPWRLLYKPSADEMANLNLYDAARQFADGANDLNDAALALRDGLKDPQMDQAKVQKLYDNLTDQFDKFQVAQDDLWKKVRQ